MQWKHTLNEIPHMRCRSLSGLVSTANTTDFLRTFRTLLNSLTMSCCSTFSAFEFTLIWCLLASSHRVADCGMLRLPRAVWLLSSPLGENNVISQAYLAVIPFHTSPDIYITLNNVPICKNINKSYLVEVTDVPEVTNFKTYTLLMRCW